MGGVPPPGVPAWWVERKMAVSDRKEGTRRGNERDGREGRVHELEEHETGTRKGSVNRPGSLAEFKGGRTLQGWGTSSALAFKQGKRGGARNPSSRAFEADEMWRPPSHSPNDPPREANCARGSSTGRGNKQLEKAVHNERGEGGRGDAEGGP